MDQGQLLCHLMTDCQLGMDTSHMASGCGAKEVGHTFGGADLSLVPSSLDVTLNGIKENLETPKPQIPKRTSDCSKVVRKTKKVEKDDSPPF